MALQMPFFLRSQCEFSFVWRIENFSFYALLDECEKFTSPIFTFLPERKFCLHFYPKSYLVKFSGTREGSCPSMYINYRFQIGTHVVKEKGVYYLDSSDCYIKFDFKFMRYRTYNDRLTIKLTIWCTEPTSALFYVKRCFAHSGIEVDKFQLSWNIKEFGSATKTSKFFTMPEIGNFQISLHISDGYIYVTIRLVSNFNCIGKPFRCEIIIIGIAGCKWKSDLKLHVFKCVDEVVEFPLLMKISDLLKEKFLNNNELSLCCNFAVPTANSIPKIKCYQSGKIGSSDHISIFDSFAPKTDEYFLTLGFNQNDGSDLNNIVATQDTVNFSSADKLTANVGYRCGKENSNMDLLCGDLQRMYNDRKFTDVVFKVGDKTLPAHKLVLAARSPVFMAMFEQDMLENKSGIINISDIEYNTLELMLSFIYGGKSQNMSFENALKLLVASHKYQIVSLQELCSTILKSMVAVDTVCEIIVYSDMSQDLELKKSAIAYFKVNAKCILQSAEWKQLLENNIKLSTEVLTEYAMTK